MLLWLPVVIAAGLFTAWLFIIFRILSLSILWREAIYWGFGSLAAFVVFILALAILFPRKRALNPKPVAISVGLVAGALTCLYFINTKVITYKVVDVDGGPIEGISVKVTHSATQVALTGFPGEAFLRTDQQGQVSIRVFRSEGCGALVNEHHPDSYQDSSYSSESVFLPLSPDIAARKWIFISPHYVEHYWIIEFGPGLPFVPQHCAALAPEHESALIQVYLRRHNSITLPPYFKSLFDAVSNTNRDISLARLSNKGSSIESFNRLDDLLANISNDTQNRILILHTLRDLAYQIAAISDDLPALTTGKTYATEEQKENCSKMLYCWLSGNAPTSLPHLERVAYIKQRMDQAASSIVEALHPLMLNEPYAYEVLGALGVSARSAMRFYPEVFDKGTPAAKDYALRIISYVGPSLNDVIFLIRSKNPECVNSAIEFYRNRNTAEVSMDLNTLQVARSHESDPQIISAFDQAINEVTRRLQAP